MRDYLPWDATAAEARAVAARLPSARVREAAPRAAPSIRIRLPESIDPRRGRRALDVQVREAERVRFGEEDIRLEAVEQLVEAAQARAIGRALAWARERCSEGRRPVREALDGVMAGHEARARDALDQRTDGDHAEFRIFEFAAALGRLRVRPG